MADIAASDVTYSIVEESTTGNDQKRANLADVTFGDGALTYPAGGVPLTKASLGMPENLSYLTIVEGDAGNGYVYKYDASAETLRIYEQDAGGELAELSAGVSTPASATLRLLSVGH